jgi:hypothetical protein
MLVGRMGEAAAEVLDYGAAPRWRRGWWWRWCWPPLHSWALPLAVLPGAIGSTHWYGDEFGALAGANLPALMLLWRLPQPVVQVFEDSDGHAMLVGATAVLLLLVGLLMDALRVRWWVYLFLPPVILLAILSRQFVPGHIPPLADETGGEWDPDALCVAWCWGVYFLAGGAIAIGLVITSLKLALRPLFRA